MKEYITEKATYYYLIELVFELISRLRYDYYFTNSKTNKDVQGTGVDVRRNKV